MNIILSIITAYGQEVGYSAAGNGAVSYNFAYIILFIGIAIASYFVQANLKSKFEKYSKMPIGLTGREIAEKMLRDNGIYDVTVTSTPGMLTDHYNPTNKTVNLSEGVYITRQA